ncbi:MAG TPA: hemolysin family protein [Acidimicrobiales bacterium]|nr:hemolysin family protein [Acidimicrobiales bacterium]
MGPQLGLVVVLVLINAVFAGSEIALISLRESRLARLAEASETGRRLAALARDPNRFLATIQIGITLAGFLASATAAVALAEPLDEVLGFLGRASRPVSIVAVTAVLTFVTLVVGELAPKRIAMQRAERWALLATRPLGALSSLARPLVWFLGKATDVVVRLLGGDPDARIEEMTEEELRDVLASQRRFTPLQHLIIDGTFEAAERTLREVVVPRPQVLTLPSDASRDEAVRLLVERGHSRAPVVDGDLDRTLGVVHLRDLIGASDGGDVAGVASPVMVLPETVGVLDALRDMQIARQHLALVINEHGGAEGIVTLEDLVEELTGEIYDEHDRDVTSVRHLPDGTMVLAGSFPVHDLVDIGVELDTDGDYTTVAGLILHHLGRIPEAPGDIVVVDGWRLEVNGIAHHAITEVTLRAVPAPAPDDG